MITCMKVPSGTGTAVDVVLTYNENLVQYSNYA
jgi:hypothetical protein